MSGGHSKTLVLRNLFWELRKGEGEAQIWEGRNHQNKFLLTGVFE